MLIRAFVSLAGLAAVVATLLFISAGTTAYWQAWTYLAIFFGASLTITLYLAKNEPALLARRMRGGPGAEQVPAQRIIQSVTSLGFIGMLVVPAIDRRFGWSHLPLPAIVAGDVLTAACFYVISMVYEENVFASATIEIAKDQVVVSTGPYAIVRHPMYAGASLLFVGSPLALGSCWGLLAFVAILPALIWRLLDEERFLAKELLGYKEYCAKVRWRLIPGVF
jgi:protein-S-isoprenylcysteine O-methyltransferase Ste14